MCGGEGVYSQLGMFVGWYMYEVACSESFAGHPSFMHWRRDIRSPVLSEHFTLRCSHTSHLMRSGPSFAQRSWRLSHSVQGGYWTSVSGRDARASTHQMAGYHLLVQLPSLEQRGILPHTAAPCSSLRRLRARSVLRRRGRCHAPLCC